MTRNDPKLTYTASDVSTSYSKTVYMWLTRQLANNNYTCKGSYLLVHVQVSVAKLIVFINGCGLIYKLQLASEGKSCL